MEPCEDSSQKGSKYYGKVNETIEEEISDHDDEIEKKSVISHSSRSSNRQIKQIKNSDNKLKGDSYFSFM